MSGMRIVAAGLLFIAFLLLFWWMASERIVRRILRRSAESLDDAARQRMLKNRKSLSFLVERKGLFYRIEQRLSYSGLAVRFSWLTPEIWVVFNLVICAGGYFLTLFVTGSWLYGMLAIGVLQVFRSLLESMMISRNYRLVNDNLLKFLDFLGNYSITAGEVTGIFSQISKYFDEPLRNVLDACYYEAQTTGDTSLALLSMAEKIEHPKFKELVWNLEISIRYSADLTVLVTSSRRSFREYIRARHERKTMVREAMVNMLILLGMAVVVLLSVERLIGTDIQLILFYTVPGRIALGVIGAIFVLLFMQIRGLDK